jgi:hypothetical protein
MPETPRYLVHTGDEETARDVLEDLPGDEPPEERIDEILEVEEHEEGATGLRGLWEAKWVRPALLVATGLAVFHQLVAIKPTPGSRSPPTSRSRRPPFRRPAGPWR